MDSVPIAMAGWQANGHTGLAADPAWRLASWRPEDGRRRFAVASLVVSAAMAGCIGALAPSRWTDLPPPPPEIVELLAEKLPAAPPPEAVAVPEQAVPEVAVPEQASVSVPEPAAPEPAAPVPDPVPRVGAKPVPARRHAAVAVPEARLPAPLAAPRPAVGAAPEPEAVASASEIAAFQDGMRRAVRAALVYPPAARMAGQRGDVHVGFDYADGVAANVAATASSGLPMLDRAAVTTVESAHLPLPPAAMAHRTLHLTITVQFEPDP